MGENLKGYKGFRKGMVCKDKQYAENTVFEEPKAKICSYGMHFCENPFDVFDYYGPVGEDGEFNEFAEVESLSDTYTNDNKKYCTTKLKVGAKLSFSGFIKTCIDFVIEKTTFSEKEIKELTNLSSGNSANIGSSGDYAKIGSSGDSAKVGSSGDYANIDSTGEDAVICCAGINSKVKAKKGSWITLSEWKFSNEKGRYVPKCVKTEFVDGERIKEDVFYMLIDGEFKEV